MCSVRVCEEFLVSCHALLLQLLERFCVLSLGNRKWELCLRDANKLSVNVFLSWLLAFERSPRRPVAIARTVRVDDKSLPVSGVSPARGSTSLSACHGSPVCPVNRQQINPSQQSYGGVM